ncbi:hypothetical protein HU200_039026 [Digitaria exilis]|uniref:Non-haem dioxygenase N-terminal domain-containing protein n=1 Tax=Digitaria exilis TaxID=1010633 RepID=A0A835EIY3_9POAL|nr:hypothetical protein HU200_039026 [Digitaria exilis]
MAPVSSAAPSMFLPTSEATLRPSFVREVDERPKVPHDRPLQRRGAGDLARRHRRRPRGGGARARGGASSGQVVDHGVDAGLVAEMTRLAREFFALPPQDKLRFDMSGGNKGGFIVSSHLQARVCYTFTWLSFVRYVQGEAVQDWREIVIDILLPDLTLGLKRHTDPRDGGRTWITVQPVEGAFVVNLRIQCYTYH